MTKKTLLAAALLLGATGTASAGGSPGTLGVGAEYLLSPFTGGGIGGPSVNYDTGAFHVGGFFFLADPGGPDNTVFGLGGRFYYHVHSTTNADFGLGGQVGFASIDGPGDTGTTALILEPGAQIRAFITTNVALSFTVGLSIATQDADGVALTGDLTGGAGVHYYFF